MDHLLGQELVNGDVEYNDTPQYGGVCQGGRNRTPREMYVPSMQGKLYDKGKYEGVEFPRVKKTTEGGDIRNQFTGAGYCTNRGVINLHMHVTAPPPKMIESQIESHLVGVVMAQQYNTKKKKELFEDKVDAAVMR